MQVSRWTASSGTPDERSLRRLLEADGYSVYAWTDGAGTTYEPHTHDDDQSHWVIRGSLALTVGGQEYVLGPGDRDWLPAGTVHSARVLGSDAVTYLIGSRRAS